jgi:hypothetical protein
MVLSCLALWDQVQESVAAFLTHAQAPEVLLASTKGRLWGQVEGKRREVGRLPIFSNNGQLPTVQVLQAWAEGTCQRSQHLPVLAVSNSCSFWGDLHISFVL